MNKDEKIEYLQTHHLSKWIETYKEEETKLSNGQSIFCVCGKLASGLHESGCRRFRIKVMNNSLKRLEHLISKSKSNE